MQSLDLSDGYFFNQNTGSHRNELENTPNSMLSIQHLESRLNISAIKSIAHISAITFPSKPEALIGVQKSRAQMPAKTISILRTERLEN